jgi:hypothetical protein
MVVRPAVAVRSLVTENRPSDTEIRKILADRVGAESNGIGIVEDRDTRKIRPQSWTMAGLGGRTGEARWASRRGRAEKKVGRA